MLYRKHKVYKLKKQNLLEVIRVFNASGTLRNLTRKFKERSLTKYLKLAKPIKPFIDISTYNNPN
ncbi:MAG: hypothetical protein B6U76_10880 [Desulfurococcales archaeon ex4484_217_2]|nr:MAG: hypothetical protein B6U76_10880 [Desulfurococcales archaeon ex4484_217_2]